MRLCRKVKKDWNGCMISNKADALIVGKHYLSFILSHELLRRKKTVFMLDDSRIEAGDLYCTSLGQLEKTFLQAWGRDLGLRPLLQLDNYLRKRPITFVLNKVQIRLGDSPHRNLLELLRKLPFVFKDKDGFLALELAKRISQKTSWSQAFDLAFDISCLEIVRATYDDWRVRLALPLSEIFLKKSSDEVKLVYHFLERFLSSKVKSEASEEEKWHLRCFLYMARGFYQDKLSYTTDPLELFHLVLGILSPRFELDWKALFSDLAPYFTECGGQFKTAHLHNFEEDKGYPWAVELDNWDGVLLPEKILAVGGIPVGLPFKLYPLRNVYSSISVSWKVKENVLINCHGSRFLFSSLERIGTSRPIWYLDFKGTDNLQFLVFGVREQGSKIDMIQKEVHQLLMRDLSLFLPIREEDVLQEEMNFGREAWIQEEVSVKEGHGGSDVFFQAADGREVPLKEVSYFGPYNGGPFGIFSTFLHIRTHLNQ